jgi:hypothetical protein
MCSLESPIGHRCTQLLRSAALVLLVGAGIASIVASSGQPPGSSAAGASAPMSVFPQRYTFGGEMLPVRVVLFSAVPAGETATFSVSSTLPAGTVSLPAGLTIPAGSSELTFNVATSRVGEFVEGRIDVTWTNRVVDSVAAPLTGGLATTLMPEPSALQLSFTPGAVPGGQPVTLQVGVTPVYPISMTIELSADSPLVQIPAQLTLPGNATSRAEQIATHLTDTARLVNITARLRGVVDIEALLVNTTASGQEALGVVVSGNGSVSSSPAGIDCGVVCGALFNQGSVVTLNPIPAPGNRFYAWGGAADCSDGVVTMNAARGCTALFTPALQPYPSGNGWVVLGSALTTASEVDPTPSLALDINHPVVAYVEAIAGDIARLLVKRLEGSDFVVLGGSALNAGSITAASEPSLVTTPTGQPYVAWIQGNGIQQNLFVARFNGVAWESVGGAGIPLNFGASSVASSPSIRLDAQRRPMVAWIENGSVKFKRFDGTAWVAAGGGEGPAGASGNRVRLSVDATGIPVLAWRQTGVGGSLLKVARDSNFAALGTQVNSAAAALPFFELLAEGSGGIVAYSETDTSFTLRSQRWSGSGWVDVGNNQIVNNNPNRLLSIAHADNGLRVAHSYALLNADVASLIVSGYSTTTNGWIPVAPSLNGNRAAQIEGLSLAGVTADSPLVAGVQRPAPNQHEARVWRYFP